VFRLPLPPVDLLGHVLLVALGTWIVGGLLRTASAAPVGPVPPGRRSLGRTEAVVVLGGLVALYLAYAVVQVVAVAGGGDRALEDAGLTAAEYARSGFFQLLWAAIATVVLLLALRATAAVWDRRLVLLAELAIGLTLVLVVSALVRLDLYADRFGLTMLRLYATVFAVWLGAVFVLLGVRFAGVGAGRRWFLPAVLSLSLVTLLGLNIANPEAVVVRHDVDAIEDGVPFDAAYLAGLSDDAVPALVESLPSLPPGTRTAVLAALCERPPSSDGWWSANRSASRADELLREVCPSG
jgi:hypothetical protein